MIIAVPLNSQSVILTSPSNLQSNVLVVVVVVVNGGIKLVVVVVVVGIGITSPAIASKSFDSPFIPE